MVDCQGRFLGLKLCSFNNTVKKTKCDIVLITTIINRPPNHNNHQSQTLTNVLTTPVRRALNVITLPVVLHVIVRPDILMLVQRMASA